MCNCGIYMYLLSSLPCLDGFWHGTIPTSNFFMVMWIPDRPCVFHANELDTTTVQGLACLAPS